MRKIQSENITQNIQQDELFIIIMQISFGLMLFAILFIILMYIHNKMMDAKKNTDERVSVIFQEILIQYINTDSMDVNSTINITYRLSKMLSIKSYQAIFKKNIMALNHLFQGEIKQKLELLYSDLGLYAETLEKLKHKNWKHKIEALSELKDLHIIKARKQIRRLVSDDNQRVSIVAMQSLMELDKHPFKFLVDYKKPITRAQAIFISKKATVMKETHYQDVLMLLQHEEPSIIKLGIQMSNILKLKDATYQLVGLLHHINEDLQVNAFVALSAIDAQNSFQVLQNFCNKASVSIIHKIMLLSDTQYVKLPFLIKHTLKNSIFVKSNNAQIENNTSDMGYQFNFN